MRGIGLSGASQYAVARRTDRRSMESSGFQRYNKGKSMAFYMIQGSYGPAAMAAMVKNPQDRAAAVRPVVKKAGGKLHDFWFAFGEYDFVVIVEMPDSTSAAAFSMAIGVTGALATYHTTLLMTPQEATKAMKQAAGIGYKAPK